MRNSKKHFSSLKNCHRMAVKSISIFLCILMITSVIPMSFAVGKYTSDVPMVMLSGDGSTIYDKDGNERWFPSIGGENENGESPALEAAKNILLPLLTEGVLFDKWDNYYDAVEKEAFDIFEGIELDENGNPSNGSGINPNDYKTNYNSMNSNKADKNGNFYFSSYRFWYDWRLDPWEVADQLHEYITNVMHVTGKSQVCLTGRCLGSCFVMAYIAKYGTDHIKGFVIDSGVCNGVSQLSDAFCGDVSIEDEALARYLKDKTTDGSLGLSDFILSSIDLLVDSGVVDFISDTVYKKLYNKLYVELTARLATATLGTWPGYWATVKTNQYDKAIEMVFGKEGSEKRVKYAGLIAKLDRYHNKVALRIPEILKEASAKGTNMCILAKYGAQQLPLSKQSANEICDNTVGLASASFGATTAKDVYSTFSDSYIAKQKSLGLEKYISADKQVDTSTCLFPDSTWIMKGVEHSDWTNEESNLAYCVASADKQLTVDDNVLGWSRFMLQLDDGSIVPMTKENCNSTEKWTEGSVVKKPTDKAGRLFYFIKSLVLFLTKLYDVITGKESISA